MQSPTHCLGAQQWRVRGLLAALALGAAGSALAADYPTKPIRFLVGVAPGGGTDFMARLVGQKLNEEWGQPVVVDNRIGAGREDPAEVPGESTAGDVCDRVDVDPPHDVHHGRRVDDRRGEQLVGDRRGRAVPRRVVE